MSKVTPEKIYTVQPDISGRILDDNRIVLFKADSETEKELNPAGLFIWQRLNKGYTVKAIAADISDAFETITLDRAIEDTSVFLEDLLRQGFAVEHTDAISSRKPLIEYPHVSDAPKSIDISLTGKCNLSCKYCFYADAMQARKDLPKEEWFSFFDELGSLSVRSVCLSGGEVFILPHLFEIIDSIIANRMRYSILTNGSLITEKIIAKFKKGRRRARFSNIQVSLDGSRPEIHDKSRGQGAFEKAVRALRLLKEAGLPVTSRVTVNRHNVDDLENIAALLLDDINIAAFGTNDAIPIGKGCSNQDEIILQPEQKIKAMKTLADLAQRYNGRISATAGPLARWRTYHDMEHAMATGDKNKKWQMGLLSACGCVFSKLSINHDGIITPCNILSTLELGRINTDSIKTIWKTHNILKQMKERRTIPMTKVPGCEDCKWNPFCNGSCPGLAYEITGDLIQANPQDCYRNFIEETGGLGI